MSYAEYVESCVRVPAKELAELRAIKLLAKEYMAATMERRRHYELDYADPARWGKGPELDKAKLAAEKALFVALGKED